MSDASEGWVRRSLVGPERLEEVRGIYESLGYEVRLEEIDPDEFSDSCGACPAALCRNHVLLYTRRTESR